MIKKPQVLNARSHYSYGTRRWYKEFRSFCDTEGPFNHDFLESEVPHEDAEIKDILNIPIMWLTSERYRIILP